MPFSYYFFCGYWQFIPGKFQRAEDIPLCPGHLKKAELHPVSFSPQVQSVILGEWALGS